MKIRDVLARLKIRTSTARTLARRARKLWRPHIQRLSVPPASPSQGRPTRDPVDIMSAEPFLTDSSLPQLKATRDLELMRDVFQRHLRPHGEEGAYQIRECSISHVRHRHGKRCMLQYTLRLAEPDAGREWSQWATGWMYAGGKTQWIWQKLLTSDLEPDLEQKTPGTSPAFAPFFYIPELDMLVQVFPYDHQLPALPLLMAGPPPELEPLLLARFGPGDWQAEAWNVEPVRYLAGRRATLRLTVLARDAATGRAEERRFYVKVYNDEEGEQTHQVLQELWDKANAGDVGFTVGRPIAYLSERRTLIQEESPGVSLQEILLREEDATPVVRKAAKALAALHLGHMTTPRRHRLQDEAAALERKGKLLQQACPHLGSEIEETVGAIVAGLEEVPLAPTHGDLRPKHIFLDGDQIGLIDFDSFAESDPVRDVSRLLALLANTTLTWRPLPQESAWQAARAFAEEYFAHVPESWRVRLPLHYAGAVLKLATGVLWSQVPGWTDKIEALVGEAKESLAGRVW